MYEASYNASADLSDGSALAIVAIIYLIVFAIGIAGKVIEMLFAKKCGAKLYGLVWLPIGREYVLGQIADKYVDKKARTKFMIMSIAAYAIFIIMYIVMFASIIGTAMTAYESGAEPSEGQLFAMIGSVYGGLCRIMIPMIALLVYEYIVYYRIYSLKNRDSSSTWLILTIVLTLLCGIGAFIPYIFMCVYMNKPNFPMYEEQAENAAPVMLPTQVDESNDNGDQQ